MAWLDMNTYIYAPKDDLKHRMHWRDLYTVDEAGISLLMLKYYHCYYTVLLPWLRPPPTSLLLTDCFWTYLWLSCFSLKSVCVSSFTCCRLL